jgi:hypothetical protein
MYCRKMQFHGVRGACGDSGPSLKMCGVVTNDRIIVNDDEDDDDVNVTSEFELNSGNLQ